MFPILRIPLDLLVPFSQMAQLVFREPREELVQRSFRKSLDLLCYLSDGCFRFIFMISNFVQKINIFEISSFLWSNDSNQRCKRSAVLVMSERTLSNAEGRPPTHLCFENNPKVILPLRLSSAVALPGMTNRGRGGGRKAPSKPVPPGNFTPPQRVRISLHQGLMISD